MNHQLKSQRIENTTVESSPLQPRKLGPSRLLKQSETNKILPTKLMYICQSYKRCIQIMFFSNKKLESEKWN